MSKISNHLYYMPIKAWRIEVMLFMTIYNVEEADKKESSKFGESKRKRDNVITYAMYIKYLSD